MTTFFVIATAITLTGVLSVMLVLSLWLTVYLTKRGQRAEQAFMDLPAEQQMYCRLLEDQL